MIHRHALHQSQLSWLPLLLLLLLNLSHTYSTPTTTLRDYLISDSEGDGEGIYLAMGPAFFGFYAYFGALAGMEDEINLFRQMGGKNIREDDSEFSPATSLLIKHDILKGVAGASAGAMAAVTLAAGVSPHRGGEFVSRIKLADFADPGGLGGIMKGNRFELLMIEFLQTLSPIVTKSNVNGTDVGIARGPLQLEEALIPVAVSAVDIHPQIQSPQPSLLQSLQSPWEFIASTYFPTAKILIEGSMARAARASACFPFLFQPVGWIDKTSSLTNTQNSETFGSGADEISNQNNAIGSNDFSLLIDGGIFDMAGYNGLKEIIKTKKFPDDKKALSQHNKIRVMNMAVGGFVTAPPGPETVSGSLDVAVDSVFSISIKGLPSCGPLTMDNGPLAIQAARRAVRASMDRPITATTSTFIVDGMQKEQHHFVLEIDASPFVDAN